MTCFSNSKRVLKFGLVFILILLFSSHELEAKKRRYVAIQPEEEKGVIFSLQGKEQTYFQLNPNKEMKITLEGPGKLKVLSRLNFSSNLEGVQKYSLEIKEDEKIIKTYSTTTERSEGVFKDLDFVPGKSRKCILEVPEGTHTYRFSLKEASPPSICLRFLFNSQSDLGKLASLTPLSYSKVVNAFIKEKLVSYFVATPDYEVKLRVIGPTKLRIVSRLNYDAKMKGEQKYAVLVKENEKIILNKPLLTTKSVGIIYRDWKEVVPGKSQTFFLEVPSGEHSYSFKPAESIAQSVSLRFSIPEENLTNEE